jgi:hypothetical protein
VPPHCDTMDGPVVNAARAALDADQVELALAYVPADGEAAVTSAFDLARRARQEGDAAREVADLYFFDTVVREHRRGEGAAHTGLQPAGLDVGPVIPVAEEAADSGDPGPLTALLRAELEHQVARRCAEVQDRAAEAGTDLAAARAAVTARLGLLVWAHKLHLAMQADAHEDGHEHHH